MLDTRIWAEPFKNTVEGRPFHMSVKIEDDRILLCAGQPVETGAKPKPELIAELLSSDIPLPDGVRSLIADWLNPDGDSALCFKQFQRRKPGRYPAWQEANLEIGVFIEEQIERGEFYDAVIAEACNKYGKGRTTVTEAYSKVLAARETQAKVCVKPIGAK